eukprot:403363786
MVEKTRAFKTFDDLIEFTGIQKEFTLNLLRHRPDPNRTEESQIREVLLNKVLDFTIQSIGVDHCMDFISKKYSSLLTPQILNSCGSQAEKLPSSKGSTESLFSDGNNGNRDLKSMDSGERQMQEKLQNFNHTKESMLYYITKAINKVTKFLHFIINIKNLNLLKLSEGVQAIFQMYSDIIQIQAPEPISLIKILPEDLNAQLIGDTDLFNQAIHLFRLQMQIADQIILETYRFHMKQSPHIPFSYEFNESHLAPYNELDQQSIKNFFISYPSQSEVSSQQSNDVGMNFRAEKVLQCEKNERYTAVVIGQEGKVRYILGTNQKKIQAYNENFSSQRTFVLDHFLVCGISNHEKFYLALQNKQLITMNSYSYEIKDFGKTSNHVTKMLVYRDKFLITAQFNGTIETLDIKRGKILKRIEYPHFLKINDIILTDLQDELIIGSQGITIYRLDLNIETQKVGFHENTKENYLTSSTIMCISEMFGDLIFAFVEDSRTFYQIDRLKVSITKEFSYPQSSPTYYSCVLLNDISNNLLPLIAVLDSKSLSLFNGKSYKSEILIDLQSLPDRRRLSDQFEQAQIKQQCGQQDTSNKQQSPDNSIEFCSNHRMCYLDNDFSQSLFLIESKKDHDILINAIFDRA